MGESKRGVKKPENFMVSLCMEWPPMNSVVYIKNNALQESILLKNNELNSRFHW